MVGYTTETGNQDGRITCTAKGWSPVPQCYSELALLISSLLLAGNFSSWISLNIQEQKLHNRWDKMQKLGQQGEINPLCIQTTYVYIWNVLK